MEKIIIENFKAIEKADIEIKNFTVFIGEQASGKSTIAKLVYFFKTLPDQILDFIVNELPTKKSILDDIRLFENLFLHQCLVLYFEKIFGSYTYLENFKLSYTYSSYFVIIEKTHITFPSLSFDNIPIEMIWKETNFFLQALYALQEEQKQGKLINYQREEEKIIRPLRIFIDSIFWGKVPKLNVLFVPASRNITVGVYDLLTNVMSEVKNKMKTQGENYETLHYSQNIQLLNEFLNYSTFLIRLFRNSGSFSEFAQKENFKEQTLLQSFIAKIEKVLKGKYNVDEYGEKLILANNKIEYLVNASSGQQEVIRLFQDLFVLLVKNTNAFRVYEEPEAHLFPAAQQKIVETIAMLINHNPAHQFLITTHSPYFIAAIDVLLEANEAYQQRIEGKNIAQKQAIENEIAALVPRSEWVDFEKVVVYSLEQNPETGKYIAKTAMRENRGVKAEIIDKVSEDIDSTYSQLLDIHYHEDGNE